MNCDTSRLTKLGSQGTVYSHEKPNSGILEVFKSPFRLERTGKIEIVFPEMSSLCPVTGQPDFATFVIEYCPRNVCVESKSLKLYFFAWRNEGAFMEAITDRVMRDLVEVLDPWWLTVQGQFNPRGGMKLWPYREWFHPEWDQTPAEPAVVAETTLNEIETE